MISIYYTTIDDLLKSVINSILENYSHQFYFGELEARLVSKIQRLRKKEDIIRRRVERGHGKRATYLKEL